jgi:hypothetical protein
VSAHPEASERRAHRLLRCYPPGWRARYGEEFVALLVDEMEERPRSLRRTVDVIGSGALARLASAGLVDSGLAPAHRLRAGLGSLARAAVPFLVLGTAVWAQLTIGWQWSAPQASGTRVAMLLMSGAAAALAMLAGLASVPLLWAVIGAFRSGRARPLLGPLLAASCGCAILTIGSLHFGHGWPGTGGHPWAGRGLVPGLIARFCWAATLWITSYWAHPGALSSFPTSEVEWMAIAPGALILAFGGTARTLRRLDLSPRLLRYEAGVGAAAAAVMAIFLAGAGSWVISGGPAPRGLFRVGAIDAVALIVMGAALTAIWGAARSALAANEVTP